MLYRHFRRALFALPPERAHALSLSALRVAYNLGYRARRVESPLSVMGLQFPNRVGLAAGFDKNGCYIDALGALGFGFIEIGTVTPRAQPGQPRPRVFRLESLEALINRMGFPNEGASVVAQRLSRRSFVGVCGVNIGKNRDTPLDRAVDDYVTCFRALAAHADYVAVNVSSPNTEGLRLLQDAQQLEPILAALQEERSASPRRSVPILVKISPDLTDRELDDLCDVVRRMHVDGVIATNTSVSRPADSALPALAERGGLSGRPLLVRSVATIRRLRERLGPTVAIVGAGGVSCAADAVAVVESGAQLVQVYTGLVYRGPGLIREIGEALRQQDRVTGA